MNYSEAKTSREAIQLAKELYPNLTGSTANDDLLMRETSPPTVTSDALDFCADIAPGHPVFVDVAPTPMARPGWCFANVADVVAKKGGSAYHGWTIWGAPGLWYNAEFHVVWKTPDDTLIDVTPKVDGEKFIMFLPDPLYSAEFDFYKRPNNRRMRTYGHHDRRDAVKAKIAGFNEARVRYEREKATQKGLTLFQSVGTVLKRDHFEKLIDGFLEDVGEFENMLKPTPNGMVCKHPHHNAQFTRRSHSVWRQKTRLFLMADMIVRGMVPGMKA